MYIWAQMKLNETSLKTLIYMHIVHSVRNFAHVLRSCIHKNKMSPLCFVFRNTAGASLVQDNTFLGIL